MYTQCPNCQTLFRIQTEQLRTAGRGEAHCSRCDHIFNAKEHLLDLPSSPPQKIPAESDASYREFRDERSSVLREMQSDRAIFKPGDEPALSANTDAAREVEPEEVATFDTEEAPEKGGLLVWSFGIITLLLLALGQFAWLERHELIRYPEGRMLLGTFCDIADCQLPPRRAPEQIEVLDRAIIIHPDREQALKIHVTLRNQASHPQPYPLLQIGFFSRNEELAAQRRFKPSEYLGSAERGAALLQSGEVAHLELDVEDPGRETSGFQIDFF